MLKKTRGIVAIAAITAAVSAGAVTTSWSDSRRDPNATPTAHDIAGAAGNHEAAFVPVAPCRVLDTRAAGGGNLHGGVTRTFVVGGTTGFAPQGGKSGGCNIPTYASSVVATISGTDATGNGYLRAWAAGTTEPNATSLLLQKGIGQFSGLTIPVSASGMSVKAVGPNARFVMDVTGYYQPSMYAIVRSDGTLVSGSRLSVASHSSTGNYTLTADSNITNCSVVSSAWSTYRSAAYGSSTSIYATVTTADGTLTNAYFQVTVTC